MRLPWPLVLVVPLVATTGLLAGPAATASNPTRCTNSWIGPSAAGDTGLWTDPGSWSRGVVPGPRARHQKVCVSSAGHVVVPVGANLQIDVKSFYFTGGGRLELKRGNALFAAAASLVTGFQVTVNGGVLGGTGKIEVDVDGVVVMRPTRGTSAISIRPCATTCKGPLPREVRAVSALRIGTGGLLKFAHGTTVVTDGARVLVNGGQVRFTGNGAAVAEGGTRLLLVRNNHQPVLVFKNDGGWYAGADRFGQKDTKVDLNGAIVAKVKGTGTSSIQGRVDATRKVHSMVDRGTLAIAGDDSRAVTLGAAAYSTGSCTSASYGCTPEPDRADNQLASVEMTKKGGADLTITEVNPGTAALGMATQIDAQAVKASTTAPAVLTLRYDATIRGSFTPTTARVAASENGGLTYVDLGDCAGGVIPPGQKWCVDRAASLLVDGDLVMVVHTLHFSRWIVR